MLYTQVLRFQATNASTPPVLGFDKVSKRLRLLIVVCPKLVYDQVSLVAKCFTWVGGLECAGSGRRRRRSETHVHDHVGRQQDQRIPSCIHCHIRDSALLDDREKSVTKVSRKIFEDTKQGLRGY